MNYAGMYHNTLIDITYMVQKPLELIKDLKPKLLEFVGTHAKHSLESVAPVILSILS
jgi:hypothetical protein